MASNSKDGSSYLDGVPVKISSKFLPPNPVTIPLALGASVSTALLSEHYDFSFERKVIEYNTKRLQELKAAKTKPPKPADVKPTTSKPQQPLDASKSAIWSSSAILQPSSQQPAGKPSSSNVKSTKINLSDFENDTSSPFDYMELQTINDLEELNSVFQGITVTKEEPPANVEEAAVSKSLSFPLPQNPCPEKIPCSLSDNFSSSLYQTNQESSLPSEPLADDPLTDEPVPTNHPTNAIVTSQDNNKHSPCPSLQFSSSAPHEVSGYSTLSQVPGIASSAVAPVRKRQSKANDFEPSPEDFRGSKSYSDISTLSDAEVFHSTRERSRTPPSVCSDAKEPVNMKIKASEEPLPFLEDHFEAPADASSNGLSDSITYRELDEASKRFVDSLTEMGFPEGQVSRAVKHLGVDEKKVVEHLCQIQALEESGYDSSEAEAALHLHDYNRDQAKEFLDLVNQFQGLGFEKDAVKKALVQNKNDWNKTIDALLS